ncbi:MAG: DUF3037 domain-containing protein [Lamprobacter sp.]|uniref:DUF3037 domain-containing protein n=1 Tax=Lamprobacter sp. TaxID=3100796 RepID=UPI002B264097|nr:DUF3037 domain-containing protein [Lamprobacter sp.]MEA3640663.1 DUF3037 domain-containing protein [Lamprobacter sp.]
MSKTPCQYAIVRFMPYVETGEFANVGILMMAPAAGYFGFELLTRRHGRITTFFEELDAKVFQRAMVEFKEELERVHTLLKSQGFDRHLKTNNIEFAKRMFAEVLRPRETIVRFSEQRVVLADDPAQTLKELFAFYVERNFVTKAYRETVLESGLRQLFSRNQLGERFHRAKVGDDEFNVTFPFVELRDDRPTKVIKPLNLAQSETTKILEHANKWEFRVRRLRQRLALPENILFAFEGPEEPGQRARACHEATSMLRDTGAVVLPYRDRTEILEFAGS